jgi:hypothetical protein
MQLVNVWLCFCQGEFHLGSVQSDFHNRQQTVIRYDKAKVTTKSNGTGVRKANQKLFPTKLGGLSHRSRNGARAISALGATKIGSINGLANCRSFHSLQDKPLVNPLCSGREIGSTSPAYSMISPHFAHRPAVKT